MKPGPIDLHRARQGLARLDTLLQAHPELREPEAQARLTAWLEEEQHRMLARPKRHTRGNPQTRARMQRLRERRKQDGWQQYELWLDPETAALVTHVKQPGESLQAVIHRALLALQRQGVQAEQAATSNGTSSASMDAMSYEQRKARLIQRMRAMHAEGLSYQKIAHQLNAAGEPTLSHQGSWRKGTVANLLTE
jgi:hypothetical protein